MFFLQDFRIPLGLASAMVFFCPLHRALIDNIEVIGDILLSFSFLCVALLLLTAWVRHPPSILASIAFSMSWVIIRLGLLGITTIRFLGSLPSAVDSLLRDGERRSVLEQEFDKFRSEYADQSDEIHVLNEKIGRVRKERNERHSVSGFAHKIPLRRRPYVFPARYQDVEWREPYTLVKMCKSFFSFSFFFLSFSVFPFLLFLFLFLSPTCPSSQLSLSLLGLF